MTAPLLSGITADTGCTGRSPATTSSCFATAPVTVRRRGHPAAARRAGRCPPGQCTVTADQRPGDIKNYAGIRDTPLILGLVLAVLAVGTLSHVLVTGVRRRRRDLAVLKALGFTRSQVRAVVAWQATALAAAALVIGVPPGSSPAAGRGRCSPTRPGSRRRPRVALPVVLLAVPASRCCSPT